MGAKGLYLKGNFRKGLADEFYIIGVVIDYPYTGNRHAKGFCWFQNLLMNIEFFYIKIVFSFLFTFPRYLLCRMTYFRRNEFYCFMKWMKWLGVLSAVLLIASCYIPWTYYPDIQEQFSGFYSKDGIFGKPGKAIIFLTVIVALFLLLPKIWAKRTNILVAGILLAYCIRCFIVYTACYGGTCPDKLSGIWLMLFSAIVLLIATLFPDMRVKDSKNSTPAN